MDLLRKSLSLTEKTLRWGFQIIFFLPFHWLLDATLWLAETLFPVKKSDFHLNCLQRLKIVETRSDDDFYWSCNPIG